MQGNDAQASTTLLHTPLGSYNTIDKSLQDDSGSTKRRRLEETVSQEASSSSSSSSRPLSQEASSSSSSSSRPLTIRLPPLPLSVVRSAKQKVARAEEANRNLVQANNLLTGTNSALTLANLRTQQEGQFNLEIAMNEGFRMQAQLRADQALMRAQGDEVLRNLARYNDDMRKELDETQKRNEQQLAVSVQS